MSQIHRALLFYLFSGVAAELCAQDFVSRQDLLDADVSNSYERIRIGADSMQFADLWLPEGVGPYQVAIIIHGGCWLGDLSGSCFNAPPGPEFGRRRVCRLEY